MEAPQIPDYMTRKGPFISANTVNGIFIITFYELDNSNLAEGMNFLGNYLAIFFGVPGFKYEIKPYFSVEEGLKMLGM